MLSRNFWGIFTVINISEKFRETTFSLKDYLYCKLISEYFSCDIKFSCKNCVKSTSFSTNIFPQCVARCVAHSVEIIEIWQKFRESNDYTKELV